MPKLQSLKTGLKVLDTRRGAGPSNSRQRTRSLNTNSAEWKRIRARVLLRDLYMCQGWPEGKHADDCNGIASEVDHLDGDSCHDTPDDLSNYQSLSKHCHSTKTAKELAGPT